MEPTFRIEQFVDGWKLVVFNGLFHEFYFFPDITLTGV